jgi:hypothetical protein
VGERLIGELREADTIAGLDGDRFAIMPAQARDLTAEELTEWLSESPHGLSAAA